jgi:hypothetical protein
MNYVIAPLPDGRRALVLGMAWQTILGDNLRKIAHKAARAGGAHWYVHPGERSHALGTLRLQRSGQKPKSGTKLYSGAAAFARAYANGAVAVEYELSDGQYWVAVAVDGVVQVESDRILPNAEAARQLIEAWREKWSNLVVYADAPEQTLTAIETKLDSSTELRRANLTLATLPPAVWIVLAAGAGWLAWDYGYGWYAEQERAKARAMQKAAPVDAVAEWRNTLTKWLTTTSVHGQPGLQSLLAEINRLPVRPGRWDLVEIDCSVANCLATYKRGELGTNESLRSALPSDWRISWSGLTGAVVAWEPTLHATNLATSVLPSLTALEEENATAWQQVLPAFSDVSIKEIGVVKIPAPMAQTVSGPQPIAFPTTGDMTLPTQYELTVNSPLRSLGLAPVPTSFMIDRLHIRYSAANQAAGLANSALTATLKGTIYAQ